MIFPYTQLLNINHLSLKYSTLIVEIVSGFNEENSVVKDIPIQHNWLCQILPYEIKIPEVFFADMTMHTILMHVIIVCTCNTCTSCGSFSSVSSEDGYFKSGPGYAVSYAGLAS